MFADPRKVKVRRLKRQLKAGASIVVALAAGVFLACTKAQEPTASPTGPDARPGPPPGPSSTTPSASAPSATTSALAVRDAGADAKASTVDRDQFRKGMPVHDNLIE